MATRGALRRDSADGARMLTFRKADAMTTPAWTVDGQYYETCSCDFVCPCLPGGLAARPTKGSCNFAMAFSIEHGSFGAVSLDGLGFIVLGYTPEEMGK